MSRFSLRTPSTLALLLAGLAACGGDAGAPQPSAAADPLPSWEQGPTRSAIIDFVARVTDSTNADYIEPAERIATFDNDGTLWSEQPMYVQLAFALDRVRQLAPDHPEWAGQAPFQAAIDNDLAALAATGHDGLARLIMATHAGMTTAEFDDIVEDWITSTRHPQYDRPYTDLTYAPMQELLAFLRASDFKTFIVSGGGIEFMRPWAEATYGIPPEQVIGSSIETRLETVDGRPVIRRLAEVDLGDDGPGKPLGINRYIGRQPVIAVGNSDGDLEMLQWSAARTGPSLQVIIHHTDADREAAYDRGSPIGGLDEALDVAKQQGWVVVDMAADWRRVFAFQEARD